MKIKLLTALLALLACTSVAQARTFFDYTKYTYQWWEETAVPHDAKITETAKNPWQMNWLKDVLMHNKEIPGNWAVDETEYVDYTVKRADGTTGDYFPEREGLTVLLYALKAGTNKENTPNEPNTAEEFKNSVDSIKLITNTTECNDAYILSFSGKWDRFYFAAKGKHRHHYYNPKKEDGHSLRDEEGNQIWVDETYPCGWELFSPTGNAFNLSDEDFDRTPNFNDILRRGGVYKITHDCSNVGGQGHYFSIAENGKLDPLENVTLVVPKKRYQQWDQTTHPGFRWPDTREGESGTKRDADGKYTWYNPDYCPRLGLYKANLTVSSQQASDEFYDEGRMYSIQLNWNSNLRDEKSLNWPGTETCNLYVLKEDGTKENLKDGSGVNKYKFTYKVPQKEQPQVFQYYVICNPTGTNPKDPVQAITDTLTVVIPGYRGLITELGYRSRFIKSEGLNSYKNTVTLYPEKESSQYRIYRKPVAIKKTTSFDDNLKQIAYIDLKYDGRSIHWTTTYSNQIEDQDSNRFDENQKNNSGTIGLHPDEFFEVYDYFTEKTVADPTKRASEYIYFISKLRFNGEWSTPVEIGTAPVYSGRLTANYNVYCEQDVYYDDDMSTCEPSKLRGLRIQDLETNQEKYADVSSYDIYVGNNIGFTGVKQVSVTGDNEIQGEPGTFYAGQLSVNSSYGVNTYGTNEVKKLNTNIIINSKKGTSAPFDNNNNIYGALVKFAGVTDKDIAPYVLGYNVKRDVQGENPVFLRKLENKQFAEGWNSDYSAIKADYPTGNTTNPVSFNDIFTGDEQTNGETYYDIRMYSTDAPMDYYDQQPDVYVTDIRIVVEHEQPISDAYHTEFSYRSRFIKDAGLNSYMNTIFLSPRLENTSYKIYRQPESLNHSTTFDETPVQIAKVTFTPKSQQILWNIDYSSQIDDVGNIYRYDDQTAFSMGAISGHPDEYVEIYDYFTEQVVADESKRAAAYTYLISYLQLNGEWSTPKRIGIAPVYSGKLGEPEYLPSYTYNQILKDMKLALPAIRGGLDATDHAEIVFTDYQNDYLSNDDFKAAIHAIHQGGKLAVQQQGNGMPKLSVKLSEYGVQQHVGEYVVESPCGENTYGTAPISIGISDVDISTPKHVWRPYGTDGTKGVFTTLIEITPKMANMFPSATSSTNQKPYVFYYNVSNYDDDFKEDILLNSLEDVVGNGWATNYAEIKKTYPIETSRTKKTTALEIRVKDVDVSEYISENGRLLDIPTLQSYFVRMYYTPTLGKTGRPTRNQKFYIVDNSTYFDFYNGDTTGVNDVNVDKSVVDVKYYNLMGVCSDKPFDGANIKVERHADGTTTSTKMMK